MSTGNNSLNFPKKERRDCPATLLKCFLAQNGKSEEEIQCSGGLPLGVARVTERRDGAWTAEVREESFPEQVAENKKKDISIFLTISVAWSI